MKKDYKNDSKKLTEALGGKENIKKVFHCMTRLRFYLNDKSKIDKNSINSLPEVSGINWHNDQLQIIVGNDVNEMYRELIALGVPSDDNSSDNEKNSFKDCRFNYRIYDSYDTSINCGRYDKSCINFINNF